MKPEFLLHEIFLWKITSQRLLSSKIEFGKIILEGGIHERCIFMQKDKLVGGTIFLNVVDSLFHHVACANIAKEAWVSFTTHHMYMFVYYICT
jgi:hypothetical protein